MNRDEQISPGVVGHGRPGLEGYEDVVGACLDDVQSLGRKPSRQQACHLENESLLEVPAGTEGALIVPTVARIDHDGIEVIVRRSSDTGRRKRQDASHRRGDATKTPPNHSRPTRITPPRKTVHEV